MRAFLSMRSWKAGIVVFLLPCIVIAAVVLLRGKPHAATPGVGPGIGFSRVTEAAPAFDLPRLQGRGTIGLSQLDGKPTVITFWASDCTVCKQEEPAIAQVARATGGSVHYLGIDTLDVRGAAISFARKYHMTYQLAFDPRGVAANSYRVPGLPETFFLSPTTRRIVGINVGALTAHSLTSILRKLYGSV
jgi:peroxiredoxin